MQARRNLSRIILELSNCNKLAKTVKGTAIIYVTI